jgi:hypothetical protein
MLKLKPGMILVALSIKIRGGVHYDRVELERELRDDHSERSAWKTVKTVADVDERQAAEQARHSARYAIKRHCTRTPWGLMCAGENEGELLAGITEARKVENGFNAGASHSHLHVAVFCGRVAEDDVEAARAVRGEIQQILRDVRGAIEGGDVRSMRDLATQTKQMYNLLDEGAEERAALSGAVKAIRRVARDVVRLVEKKGDELESVLTEENLKPINDARWAFRHLAAEEATEELPSVNAARFAAGEEASA